MDQTPLSAEISAEITQIGTADLVFGLATIGTGAGIAERAAEIGRAHV